MRIGVLAVSLAAALVLTGCASSVQPRSFSSPTANADPYACALAHLNVSGYTVVDANKEAGFIRAEKKTSGIGNVIWMNRSLFDQITVSVFQHPTAGTTLRLTSATMIEKEMGWGAGKRSISDPSPTLESDSKALLDACK